jgi:uncharacterized tellurite resistance protein B-like protein
MGLFSPKRNENPIYQIYKDLTTNQKMSLINFLTSIAAVDGKQGNFEQELNYIASYCETLNVKFDRSREYFLRGKREQIIYDLNSMNKDQKELLINIAFGVVTCDGPPNQQELDMIVTMFDLIGIDEDKIIENMEKTAAIRKLFDL